MPMITTMMLTYALVFHALSRSFAADFSLIVLLLVDRFPALSVFSCLTAIAAPLQRMCMNLNTGALSIPASAY